MDFEFAKVYTIGYAGFPNIEDFVATLKKYGINVLIDVRSSPYSSRFETYNKENIERILKESGIYYRHYAREFGARQEDPVFYTNGILDFRKFSDSAQFADGIDKIDKTVSAGYVPVLMCAEKEPVSCHRAIMVCKKLEEELWSIEILHIMPDGHIKTKKDIDNELLDIYFPDRDQFNFFSETNEDEKQLIEEAYVKQNWKIGFHKEDL